jgi:L-threonylcarbamoyladenylate synthase
MILDGGPCEHGLESTVLDCTVDPPTILRPGPISAQQLAKTLGVQIRSSKEACVEQGRERGEALRSPGSQHRHYAPRTRLTLSNDAVTLIPKLLEAGHRVGWLSRSAHVAAVVALAASPNLVVIPMPEDPVAYARSLYATLHAIDQRELDRLVVDAVPADSNWAAVHDRLQRAAT